MFNDTGPNKTLPNVFQAKKQHYVLLIKIFFGGFKKRFDDQESGIVNEEVNGTQRLDNTSHLVPVSKVHTDRVNCRHLRQEGRVV